MMLYHVGVSGGKDSTAALLFMVYESGIDKSQINATFCDTGNETDETYAHVKMLSDKVHPIETITPPLDFYELAKHKRRFPSTRARFCTQELKIFPTQKHIFNLRDLGHTVVAVSGVRAQESAERAKLPEREFSMLFACDLWRPLLHWSIKDVWYIHKKYNISPNPMYAMGAMRVGCAPCINSRKSEIRMMARNFPERIERIKELENNFPNQNGFSSFFPRLKKPEQYRSREITTKDGNVLKVPTIDDVVKWSRLGGNLDFESELDGYICDIEYGACE